MILSVKSDELRLKRGELENFGKELLHPSLDLITNYSDRRYTLTGWIFKYPIFVTFTRIVRAGIPTAHCDYDI